MGQCSGISPGRWHAPPVRRGTTERKGLTAPWRSVDRESMTARRTLLAVAVLFAIGEALDSIDVGWFGVIFAVLFAAGALLMRRGGRSGVILVGTLVFVEVVAWPTFKRHTTTDWIIQIPFLILGLVGLAALGIFLFRGRRTERTARPT